MIIRCRRRQRRVRMYLTLFLHQVRPVRPDANQGCTGASCRSRHHLRIHWYVLSILTAFLDTLWLWMQRHTIVLSDCTHDPVLLLSASRGYLSCRSHPDTSTMELDFTSHLGVLRTFVSRIRDSSQNRWHLAACFVHA